VLTPEPGLGIPDVGLGDTIADPTALPAGCRFHPRCPLYRQLGEPERCRTEDPALAPSGNSEHTAACHFIKESD